MRKIFSSFWIFLFFIVIVVPLFHMNTSEITEQENRTLAKFPETKKKNKPNYDFGKEFESWLGDRFWGRDKLINTRFQMMYKINGRIENDKAFVGDDGWMFEKDGIVNVPSLEKQREKIAKDADILKRFDDKFKGKNTSIYLVLIPDRNQLYQKYWEKYYAPKPKLDYGDGVIKALKDHPNIHIIYPKEEFLKNKDKNELFLKYDTHLSWYGSNILAQKISDKQLLKNSQNFKIYETSRSYIKSQLLDMSNIHLGLDMKQYVNSNNKKIKKSLYGEKDKTWPYFKILYNNEQSGNAYIFGNCYGVDIIAEVISLEKKNVYFFRLNYKEDYKNLYNQFKKHNESDPIEEIYIINQEMNPLNDLFFDN